MKIHCMLALLLLGACTAENTPQPIIESPGEQSQAPMGRDLHWMRNSAEYKAIVLQTYRLAALQLQVLVADKKPGTWAVATDADETVVDTSNFTRQWDRVGRQSPSAEALWQASAARQADPPLPGAVQFLQLVHSLGGRIAVVTNRSDANCPGLEANFLAFDIPFDIMLCKGDDPRKESRWEAVENGTTSTGLPPLEIVMWLGDNIQDFPQADQQLRLEDKEAFISFGEHYFAFPNPTYGSWEENSHD
jgi:acid phosphatase